MDLVRRADNLVARLDISTYIAYFCEYLGVAALKIEPRFGARAQQSSRKVCSLGSYSHEYLRIDVTLVSGKAVAS